MLTIQSYLDSILNQLQPVLDSTAKNLLRHLSDCPEAQAQGTFDQLETIHPLVADRLLLTLFQQALQLRADELQKQPPPNCPQCQQTTQLRPPRLRSLQTDHGTVEWNESECFCERCRKAFFPSVAATPN